MTLSLHAKCQVVHERRVLRHSILHIASSFPGSKIENVTPRKSLGSETVVNEYVCRRSSSDHIEMVLRGLCEGIDT